MVKSAKTLKFLFPLLLLAVFSCKKTDGEENPNNDRMVLVYIAANNDLEDEAVRSVQQLRRGALGLNGNLLVYVKTTLERSHLLKIRQTDGSYPVWDTLKTYRDENTSDPAFFASVIRDARAFSLARSYGLVLWSHATSWAPPAPRVGTFSFGRDDGQEMDVRELWSALPDDHEFILFDACSMASMEVVFELRDKVRYILSSPTEVLSSGFSYDEIAPDLFAGLDGLKRVSKSFIDHYNRQSGLYSSATVSLLDTKELTDLAQAVREFVRTVPPNTGYDLSAVQRLDFDTDLDLPAYDMAGFLENNYDSERIAPVLRQLDKAVLYKGHTERFFNVPIRQFCGLSIHLPDLGGNRHTDYYRHLDWDKTTGWSGMFRR